MSVTQHPSRRALGLNPCVRSRRQQAVRIRQVADPAVGSMPSAISTIVAESGWGKLYEGLPSILFRQISFGMMKFLVFDFFTGESRSTARASYTGAAQDETHLMLVYTAQHAGCCAKLYVHHRGSACPFLLTLCNRTALS